MNRKIRLSPILLGAALFLFSSAAAEEGVKLVRITAPDRVTIENILRGGFDVTDVKPGKFMEILLMPHEVERLNALGVDYSVEIPDMAEYYRRTAGTWKKGGLRIGEGRRRGYFGLDTMFVFLDSLQAAHPAVMAQKENVGSTRRNRTMWMYKISDNPELDEDEPEVLYTGLTHAREPGGPTAHLYFMEWLLNGYAAGDAEAVYLVENRELYFIPIVNPDGYAVNDSTDPDGGGMWRKNARDNDSNGVFSKSNDGVDLNRNFDYGWGYNNLGSSPDSTSNVYRGPNAASEPEVQALQNFVAAREFKVALNFHTYGGLMIWPWAFNDSETADSMKFREAASGLTKFSKYSYGRVSQTLGYHMNGYSDDYMYGVEGMVAMTPEVGNRLDGFWPSPSRVVPLARQMLFTIRHLAWIGGAYLNAEGFVIDDSAGGDGDGWLDPGETVDLIVDVRNKGFGSGATGIMAVLTSNDSDVTIVTESASFGDADTLTNTDNSASPFSIALGGGATPGDSITFYIEWSASATGSYTSVDTLHIVVGSPVILFFDDAEDGIDNWVKQGRWGVSDVHSTSGEWAFDDSPYQPPDANRNDAFRLKEGLDFTSADAAFVRFNTRYDIDRDFDGVVVEFSGDGGSSWNILKGQDTKVGVGGAQPVGKPVFNGFRDHFWLEQFMDASAHLGANPVDCKVRFRSLTNGRTERDGFLFDDIAVGMYTSEEILPVLLGVSVLENTDDTTGYRIDAVASDNGRIDSVVVYYSTGSPEGFDAVQMEMDANFHYEGMIPGQPLGTTVDYYVSAFDDSGASTTVPEGAPAVTYSFLVDVYTGMDEITELPESYLLEQNYPNPFNPATTIEYALPRSGNVLLTIYNLLGEEIGRLVDGEQPAGHHQVTWDASNEASGIYLYRIRAGGYTEVRKIVLLR